nr:hypothetical protein [uncultured Dongia sp.]
MTSKFNKIRGLVAGGATAAAALILLSVPAQSAPRKVAIVEDSAKTEGLGQAFDLLAEHDTVTLAVGETLVLGYLKSCIRETITGGTVTVGTKESVVEGGKVSREKTECAVNKLALTADESQQSATIAFRGTIKHIFTRQPLIMAGKSEGVTIEPFEGGESWKLVPENDRIDFQAAKLEMQPGKSYRVKGASSVVVVEVDDKATTAKTGPLERVVVLD